jgi:NADP-dependent 3-hydroxy acid dehydrogenase YdfG
MADKRLGGQVAVVTGASKGIGKAIAHALAREGAHVVLAARSQKDLDAVVREFTLEGLNVSPVPTDMSIPAQVSKLIGGTVEGFGRLDVLVNNAGIGIFKNVEEMSVEEFDAMWKVNLRGVFLASKAALPAMIKANRGVIVNIASLAGKNSIKGGAGYCATKWALRGFSSSLMLEVREHNIRVVTVFPGSVETNFSQHGKKGPSITQPDDVADVVVFAVTAPERSMFSEIDVRPTNPPR